MLVLLLVLICTFEVDSRAILRNNNHIVRHSRDTFIVYKNPPVDFNPIILHKQAIRISPTTTTTTIKTTSTSTVLPTTELITSTSTIASDGTESTTPTTTTTEETMSTSTIPSTTGIIGTETDDSSTPLNSITDISEEGSGDFIDNYDSEEVSAEYVHRSRQSTKTEDESNLYFEDELTTTTSPDSEETTNLSPQINFVKTITTTKTPDKIKKESSESPTEKETNIFKESLFDKHDKHLPPSHIKESINNAIQKVTKELLRTVMGLPKLVNALQNLKKKPSELFPESHTMATTESSKENKEKVTRTSEELAKGITTIGMTEKSTIEEIFSILTTPLPTTKKPEATIGSFGSHNVSIPPRTTEDDQNKLPSVTRNLHEQQKELQNLTEEYGKVLRDFKKKTSELHPESHIMATTGFPKQNEEKVTRTSEELAKEITTIGLTEKSTIEEIFSILTTPLPTTKKPEATIGSFGSHNVSIPPRTTKDDQNKLPSVTKNLHEQQKELQNLTEEYGKVLRDFKKKTSELHPESHIMATTGFPKANEEKVTRTSEERAKETTTIGLTEKSTIKEIFSIPTTPLPTTKKPEATIKSFGSYNVSIPPRTTKDDQNKLPSVTKNLHEQQKELQNLIEEYGKALRDFKKKTSELHPESHIMATTGFPKENEEKVTRTSEELAKEITTIGLTEKSTIKEIFSIPTIPLPTTKKPEATIGSFGSHNVSIPPRTTEDDQNKLPPVTQNLHEQQKKLQNLIEEYGKALGDFKKKTSELHPESHIMATTGFPKANEEKVTRTSEERAKETTTIGLTEKSTIKEIFSIPTTPLPTTKKPEATIGSFGSHNVSIPPRTTKDDQNKLPPVTQNLHEQQKKLQNLIEEYGKALGDFKKKTSELHPESHIMATTGFPKANEEKVTRTSEERAKETTTIGLTEKSTIKEIFSIPTTPLPTTKKPEATIGSFGSHNVSIPPRTTEDDQNKLPSVTQNLHEQQKKLQNLIEEYRKALRDFKKKTSELHPESHIMATTGFPKANEEKVTRTSEERAKETTTIGLTEKSTIKEIFSIPTTPLPTTKKPEATIGSFGSHNVSIPPRTTEDDQNKLPSVTKNLHEQQKELQNLIEEYRKALRDFKKKTSELHPESHIMATTGFPKENKEKVARTSQELAKGITTIGLTEKSTIEQIFSILTTPLPTTKKPEDTVGNFGPDNVPIPLEKIEDDEEKLQSVTKTLFEKEVELHKLEKVNRTVETTSTSTIHPTTRFIGTKTVHPSTPSNSITDISEEGSGDFIDNYDSEEVSAEYFYRSRQSTTTEDEFNFDYEDELTTTTSPDSEETTNLSPQINFVKTITTTKIPDKIKKESSESPTEKETNIFKESLFDKHDKHLLPFNINGNSNNVVQKVVKELLRTQMELQKLINEYHIALRDVKKKTKELLPESHITATTESPNGNKEKVARTSEELTKRITTIGLTQKSTIEEILSIPTTPLPATGIIGKKTVDPSTPSKSITDISEEGSGDFIDYYDSEEVSAEYVHRSRQSTTSEDEYYFDYGDELTTTTSSKTTKDDQEKLPSVAKSLTEQQKKLQNLVEKFRKALQNLKQKIGQLLPELHIMATTGSPKENKEKVTRTSEEPAKRLSSIGLAQNSTIIDIFSIPTTPLPTTKNPEDTIGNFGSYNASIPLSTTKDDKEKLPSVTKNLHEKEVELQKLIDEYEKAWQNLKKKTNELLLESHIMATIGSPKENKEKVNRTVETTSTSTIPSTTGIIGTETDDSSTPLNSITDISEEGSGDFIDNYDREEVSAEYVHRSRQSTKTEDESNLYFEDELTTTTSPDSEETTNLSPQINFVKTITTTKTPDKIKKESSESPTEKETNIFKESLFDKHDKHLPPSHIKESINNAIQKVTKELLRTVMGLPKLINEYHVALQTLKKKTSELPPESHIMTTTGFPKANEEKVTRTSEERAKEITTIGLTEKSTIEEIFSILTTPLPTTKKPEATIGSFGSHNVSIPPRTTEDDQNKLPSVTRNLHEQQKELQNLTEEYGKVLRDFKKKTSELHPESHIMATTGFPKENKEKVARTSQELAKGITTIGLKKKTSELPPESYIMTTTGFPKNNGENVTTTSEELAKGITTIGLTEKSTIEEIFSILTTPLPTTKKPEATIGSFGSYNISIPREKKEDDKEKLQSVTKTLSEKEVELQKFIAPENLKGSGDFQKKATDGKTTVTTEISKGFIMEVIRTSENQAKQTTTISSAQNSTIEAEEGLGSGDIAFDSDDEDLSQGNKPSIQEKDKNGIHKATEMIPEEEKEKSLKNHDSELTSPNSAIIANRLLQVNSTSTSLKIHRKESAYSPTENKNEDIFEGSGSGSGDFDNDDEDLEYNNNLNVHSNIKEPNKNNVNKVAEKYVKPLDNEFLSEKNSAGSEEKRRSDKTQTEAGKKESIQTLEEANKKFGIDPITFKEYSIDENYEYVNDFN